MKVYFDNCTTTKTDPLVVKRMLPFFAERYGVKTSEYSHSFGQECQDVVEKSRQTIAKSINAKSSEIIFTSGETESNNTVINNFSKNIITSKIEHSSILETCNPLKSVIYLDVDKQGFVDLLQLKKSINKNTGLVSVQHANQEIGTIQNIKEIGKICKEKNVLFHSDISQSFIKEKIDVKKMNINLLTLSSHLIHGPKGVGALYVRNDIQIKKAFRGSEVPNTPAIVGFADAVSIITKTDIGRMTKLRDYFIKKIVSNIPKITLIGHEKKRLCNNINVSFKNIEGESIVMHLGMDGIYVSTGSACSSDKLKESHVLSAMGLNELSHGSIRICLSKYNTKKELDYSFEKLGNIVEKLRKMSPIKR